MTGLRAVAGTVALVTFGCVLALGLLEALLQAGSVFMPASRDASVPEATRSGPRIAMLGDSNTYGLYVERAQAYPQRLEARWNETAERTGAQRIQVLNLAYPGMSSATLRNRFLEVLRIHRPDVVTILVGVNDTWTVAESADEAQAPWQRVKRASRVYQLFLLLRHGRRDLPGVEPQGRWAPSPRPPVDWEPQLRANLGWVVEQAQRAGVQPILLTYPSNGLLYDSANHIVREMASKLRVPLVDLTRSFWTECAGGRACDLLFQDQHPTARGHELVASRIEEALRRDPLLLAPLWPKRAPAAPR